MEFYVDYAQKKVFITFDTGNTPVPDSKILLECYIQGTPYRKQEKFVNGKASCVLPMPKPGRYSMAGMVRLDGQFFFDIFVNLEIAEKAQADFINVVSNKGIPDDIKECFKPEVYGCLDAESYHFHYKKDAYHGGKEMGKRIYGHV